MDTKPNESCEGCGSRRPCHSIYQRLGYTKGPSIAGTVLAAFGIPIVVFIITLAAASAWLGRLAEESDWPMLLAFLIALALTAVVVLVIWKITQRPVDHREPPNSESVH
jgi:hypothetical protein